MPVRDTSQEAYKKVIQSGLLTQRLIKVFTVVHIFGPATSRELNRHYVNRFKAEDNLNQFRASLTHLQDMGVVRTTAKVVCSISEMKVYQFDTTGLLPVRSERKRLKDKKRDILNTISRVEPWVSGFVADEVERLKSQVENL